MSFGLHPESQDMLFCVKFCRYIKLSHPFISRNMTLDQFDNYTHQNMKNGLSPLHWWTINPLEHEDIYSCRWQSFAKMWQSTKSSNTTLWKSLHIIYKYMCVFCVVPIKIGVQICIYQYAQWCSIIIGYWDIYSHINYQQNNNYLDKEHVAVLECSWRKICQEFNNTDILTAYSCTNFQQHVNRSLPSTE